MTMSNHQRDTVSRWLPTIVALVGVTIAVGGHITYMSKWAGQLEQRVSNIETLVPQIVPRAEYSAMVANRSAELADIKRIVSDTNNKIDKLIERELQRNNR